MELNSSAKLDVLGGLLTKVLSGVPGVVGVIAGDGSFDDFISSFGKASVEPRQAGLRYKASERDGSVFFSVALAGVHESDVTVDVTEDSVVVSAKFFDEGDEDGSVPVIRSFVYDIEDEEAEYFVASDVVATLKRGLLSLRVPVKSREASTGSRVKIKVG